MGVSLPSVAQFYLASATEDSIRRAARALASGMGLRIDESDPHFTTLRSGSRVWTWRRTLRVGAWNVPGGANVSVEAWADTILISDLAADPNQLFGILPRRSAWRLASSFLAFLGISQPEPLFRHT